MPFMSIIRLILLTISTLTLMVILAAWSISGRSADLLVFAAMIFLAVNTIYLSFSKSTLQTSKLFSHLAARLAFASYALQHQAAEAESREAVLEKIRAEEAELKRHKLLAAKEFLSHLQEKRLSSKEGMPTTHQITASLGPPSSRIPALPDRGIPRAEAPIGQARSDRAFFPEHHPAAQTQTSGRAGE
ncbi:MULTISPECIES: hypothetical protein [unclassified Methylobacterium]|uniref:hypothetical protein n=1 Tax=unclassified Methylobacterium TaxID=2615210 RepID=UPI00226A492B|nr:MULTISPECIES: hypothetical protein [unclassified Methylobacterium]